MLLSFQILRQKYYKTSATIYDAALFEGYIDSIFKHQTHANFQNRFRSTYHICRQVTFVFLIFTNGIFLF